MKQIRILLIISCLIFLSIACKQTVVIKPDQDSEMITKTETETVIVHHNAPAPTMSASSVEVPSFVRILFYVKSDYPSGVITPDSVYMDGSLLVENSSITKGQHTFEIEKRGYNKATEVLNVDDPDGDGNYPLSITLSAKERVIIFDIRDEENEEVVTPDQVNMVQMPEGQEQMISDRSLVIPGRKKVVIQKQGYVPFAQEISIDADEEPFILNCKIKKN
jgi:hypothetical protein